MAKKRKNNIARIFLRGFIQSFFIVVILLSVGVLGYKVTMKYWMPKGETPEVTQAPEPSPEPITTASVDDVSKNLIFCYDKDKNKLNKLVLEIFHCKKKQMTYITIPMDTQFTMSDTLYKKLCVVQPATPQIIRLSTMTKYFGQDTVFDYGVLMVEDMLQLEISYYTVIPKELYDTIFTEQEITRDIDKTLDTDKTLDADKTLGTDKAFDTDKVPETEEATQEPVEVFTKGYLKFLKGIQSEEELKSYIEEIYPSLTTNLSLQDKMNYLDSYRNTPLSNISFERIPGKEYNSGFVLDEIPVRERLLELIAY